MSSAGIIAREDNIFTVGVFVVLYGGYHDAITHGIAEVIAENNGKMICFVGAALNDQVGFRKYWNTIYDMASSENLDGLVVLSNALSEFVTIDELTRFCTRFDPLPIVSIGQKLAGIATITTNNSVGLTDLMHHLLEHHQYQRIAFIRGPVGDREADERFQVYRDALEKFNIPFDPTLLLQGNYLEYSGVDAIHTLLDDRQVMPEVIVASNDLMAIGAWRELARRGFEIPRDLAITGFDDMVEASSFSTPLSTVSQTLTEQGRIAARMLIEAYQKNTPPEDYLVDTTMVLRESCGCLPEQVSAARADQSTAVTVSAGLPTEVRSHRDAALTQIQQIIGPHFSHVDNNEIEAVVDAFFAVLQSGVPHQFMSTFSRLLQTASSNLGYTDLQTGIMSLWHDALGVLSDKALLLKKINDPEYIVTLLRQAQILVSRAAERAHTNLRDRAERDTLLQAEIVRDISVAEDIQQIADILGHQLPKLGISTAAMAFFQGPTAPSPTSKLVMACNEGQNIELGADGCEFASLQIIPPTLVPREKWPLLTLHPLVALDTQFGYIVMELTPGSLSTFSNYMSLSEQIGATLYRVLLQQQIKQTNADLLEANEQLKALNVELDRARQAAEQANTVKSKFLAAMSHELRTPLNGILNYAQFVSSGMLGPVNEKQIDVLQKTKRNGEHLLSLINDVLDISKIEAGSLTLFVEDNIDLRTELEAVVDTGQAILDGKPVEIIIEIANDFPLIRCDKRRVRQIMLNLVSNACKFTEEGTITIRLERQNDEVLIVVCDTGPGIAAADHDAVFETFQQTKTGLRKAGGTGLGLPISKRLAEAHGGRLWLESERGQGATFLVALPVKSEALIPTLTS